MAQRTSKGGIVRQCRERDSHVVGRDQHDRRILIIVQNLPVPFDRRVWLECQSLRAAGYRVSVVCPKGPGDPGYSVVEGVELYKYRPYATGGGLASFVIEYVYSFVATLLLTAKAARSGRFAVIQSCNPPDIFWPIGALFRAIHGSRFVFDHHDLCPELYQSRFPQGRRALLSGLLVLERRSVRGADHVISTNGSYRRISIKRHGLDPDRVSVVRTGPDPERLKPASPQADHKRGRRHLVAYIGVMGPQDGVDIVLRTADEIVHRLGRTDIAFTLIGSGDCFEDLLSLRSQLGLDDIVEFTGRVPDEVVASVLSSADVGISPDPKNPLNDVSTMNKTMEYMSFGLPVVAFDLVETRVSAGEAAEYAIPNDTVDLAKRLVALLDDEDRRREMGTLGRKRVVEELAWCHQAPVYVGVFDELSAGRGEPDMGAGRVRDRG